MWIGAKNDFMSANRHCEGFFKKPEAIHKIKSKLPLLSHCEARQNNLQNFALLPPCHCEEMRSIDEAIQITRI